MSGWRSAAVAALLGAGVLGCKEQIVAPGVCPGLCPAGQVVLADTVLTGIVVSDSSYRGFVSVPEASALILGTESTLTSIAVIRFAPRGEFWFNGTTDTVFIAAIDSLRVSFRIADRDTSIHGQRLVVYRLPVSTDTLATFASVSAILDDSLLVDTIAIPDTTLVVQEVRKVVPVSRVPLDPSDSGVVVLAVRLLAPTPTITTVASNDFTGTPAIMAWFAHNADTLVHTFATTPTYDTYVQTPVPPAASATELLVGNLPSARALIRFALPAWLVDSTTVVRASLILTPTRPVRGRRGETFTLEGRGIIRDFGGKSYFTPDSALSSSATVTVGDSTAITLEMGHVLRAWRNVPVDTLPRTMLLRAGQEGLTIGDLAIGRGTSGAAAPRMVVTYIRPYTFGVP